MHIFGRDTAGQELDAKTVSEIVTEGRRRSPDLAATPTEKILDVLHRVGELWREGSPFFAKALSDLPREIPFSEPMIRETLRLLPDLFDRGNLIKRLDCELGGREVLDRFAARPPFTGRLRAVPRGVVFHATAGNVFLGCIDSLLMGFLTKNISIMKLSSKNRVFPRLFVESLKEADADRVLSDKFALIHFPGGSAELEAVVKTRCDVVAAWGGDAMIESYKRGLAPGVKLLEYGPKFSFEVVLKRALERLGFEAAGSRIARELCLWDQAACASPQNLFIEDGLDRKALLDAVCRALDRHDLPRGVQSPDEEVEALKEVYRAKLTAFTEGGEFRRGKDYLIHFDPNPGARPSALNRTLIIKGFKDLPHLAEQLRPLSYYLQSASYLADGEEKDRLLEVLAAIGVKRFAPLGTVMEGMAGAPHDGSFCLREMVAFVGDECRPDFTDFVNEAIRGVPYYRDLREGRPVRELGEMPLLSAEDLAAHPLPGSRAFLREDAAEGYVFSSSGTTGSPKFTFYSHGEFDAVGKLLAKGLALHGLKEGDVAANLFMAGNMWSSFMAIERALAHLKAVQLPIGGQAQPELILDCLDRFRPKAVFALPSHLVELAHKSLDSKPALDIPFVFYAGEHLNAPARKLLSRAWNTTQFRSAGYASVDAGPIGYQCPSCGEREHHLFSELVHLETVEGEAVVTSMLRTSMPIIRLRTGDLVEMSPQGACGSSETKFTLLGRCDSRMNIWGCRVFLGDIERALGDRGIAGAAFQVILDRAPGDGAVDEIMTITVEGEEPPDMNGPRLCREVYDRSQDVRKTHPFDWIEPRLQLKFVPPGTLPRAGRTGKIKLVVDKRT